MRVNSSMVTVALMAGLAVPGLLGAEAPQPVCGLPKTVTCPGCVENHPTGSCVCNPGMLSLCWCSYEDTGNDIVHIYCHDDDFDKMPDEDTAITLGPDTGLCQTVAGCRSIDNCSLGQLTTECGFTTGPPPGGTCFSGACYQPCVWRPLPNQATYKKIWVITGECENGQPI